MDEPDAEQQPLLERNSLDSQDQAKIVQLVDNDVLPETSSLGRNIGWGGAYVLVISRVIGSGIFAMPGAIVQNVGSPGLALLLWIIGALVAWAGLVIDIEYGCTMPRSGGVKVYLEYTYRKPRFFASTMVAVRAVLLGFTAANCIVFAKYVLFAFDIAPTDVPVKLLAVSLLTWITLVHGCFYKTGIFIQNVLGWLKIGLIIFTILTGVFVVLWRPQQRVTSTAWHDLWEGSDLEWNTLCTAFFKVLYSYAGLSNVNNVLNEVKNPIRTVKYVGPVALLTACLMYVLINVAYLAVIPLEDVRRSRELIAALYFDRLGFGKAFLPLAIAFSAAGNVMVVTFSSIARAGFLPASETLASNKPFNAPMGGLLVHYVPSVLVIVLPPAATVYAFIADVEGYAGQYFALAIGAGLILLRYQKPDLHRPFRAWLPAVVLRIVLCICLIIAPLFPPRQGTGDVGFFYASYALVGISILIFGVIYWYTWTIALPQYRGYRLEEEKAVIDDGTTISKLVHKEIA